MNKVQIRNMPLVYPLPAVLMGTMVNGVTNYTTLGNCGIVSVSPAVLYVSSGKEHHGNRGVHESMRFSVNVPSASMAVKTDYCGIVSGRDVDKSKLFETFFGKHPAIPMIKECPINLACEVLTVVPVFDMEVFIGAVVETYVDQDCFCGDWLDTKKIDPLIYCMDNRYWGIGSEVGRGFEDGKQYVVDASEPKGQRKVSPIIGSGQTPRSIIPEGNRPQAVSKTLPDPFFGHGVSPII